MHKLGHVAIVIGLVAACYLMMLIVIPDVVVPMIETANATMTASSNLTQYPGTSDFLISIPWIIWFVPASIGGIAIVIIMRRP